MEWATDAKSIVEEAQREDRKRREEKGEHFRPRFFETKNGRWVPKLKYVLAVHFGQYKSFIVSHSIPKEPQAAIAAVQEWIFPSSSGFVLRDAPAAQSTAPLATSGSTDLNGRLPPPIPLTAS